MFTETFESTSSLRVAFLNGFGQRSAEPLDLASDLAPSDAANPVLTGLPNGRYVAGWADLAEGSLDVVLRSFSDAGDLGAPKLANATHSGAQFDPDLVWAGGELVAAWTDGFAVKARTFSDELEPTSEEHILSTLPFAGRVTLAPHASSWAAAFREPTDLEEQTTIVLSDETRFEVGPFAPASSDERPALVSLDSTHLLSVFCNVVSGVARLRGAILDAHAPENVVDVSLAPTLARGIL